MKSRTKWVRPAVDAGNVDVQLSLLMAGVLRDVRHAFFRLRMHAGKQVLAAMMEADREALCGPKGRPDVERYAYRGGNAGSKVVLGANALRSSARAYVPSRPTS
jgi:hypothetical protein